MSEQSEQREKAENQCTVVKREMYKLREQIDAIQHVEDREMALKMFNRAYIDMDVLQTFIQSR